MQQVSQRLKQEELVATALYAVSCCGSMNSRSLHINGVSTLVPVPDMGLARFIQVVLAHASRMHASG